MAAEFLSQTLFNALIAICGFAGSWWLKSTYDEMKELRTKMAALEVIVAGKYQTRDEAAQQINAVFKKLDKIEAKVDMALYRGQRVADSDHGSL